MSFVPFAVARLGNGDFPASIVSPATQELSDLAKGLAEFAQKVNVALGEECFDVQAMFLLDVRCGGWRGQLGLVKPWGPWSLCVVCFSSFCWGSKSLSLVGYLLPQMVDGRLQAEAPGCLLLCKPMNYSYMFQYVPHKSNR